MKPSLRWMLLGAFALVFLAGLAVGFFTSPFVLAHRALRGMRPENMLSRLQWQLNLTAEQRDKIKPIAERTAQQLQSVRRETGQRVRDILLQSHREILPLLSPEQREKLQRLEERHRAQARRFGHRGPPP